MSFHPPYSPLAICDDVVKSQVTRLIILTNHLMDEIMKDQQMNG
jgi:hypothetical protein